jgi:hypothetical protein
MQTYEQLRGHKADFLVQYRLYSPSEGGRRVTVQHLRFDFLYRGDDLQTLFMIHPEFLDASGHPIPEGVPVPLEGAASMWVVVPEMRARVHRGRIAVGVRGHFMEGPRKIGDVQVTQVLGLNDNPDA